MTAAVDLVLLPDTSLKTRACRVFNLIGGGVQVRARLILLA